MAHQHTILASPREPRTAPAPAPAVPVPAVPDFELPLLDNRAPAYFSRKIGATRRQGRVFHQFREPGSTAVHPTTFYVEWPADSGAWHELHAPRLARIIGDGGGSASSWDTARVAGLISQAPASAPLPALFTASCKA